MNTKNVLKTMKKFYSAFEKLSWLRNSGVNNNFNRRLSRRAQSTNHHRSEMAFKVVQHFSQPKYIMLGFGIYGVVSVKNCIEERVKNFRLVPDISKIESPISKEQINSAARYTTESIYSVYNMGKDKLPGLIGYIPKPSMDTIYNAKNSLMKRWWNSDKDE